MAVTSSEKPSVVVSRITSRPWAMHKYSIVRMESSLSASSRSTGEDPMDMITRSTSAPADLPTEFYAGVDAFAKQLSATRPGDVLLSWSISKKRRRQECSTEDCVLLKRATSAPPDLPTHVHVHDQEVPLSRSEELEIASWNIASPNLNPFEYWVTHESDAYTDLMAAVQKAIDHPLEQNVELKTIFTDDMFRELKEELTLQGMKNLEELEELWSKMKECKAITGFLKDTSIGEKRLISMPDRITSSLKTVDGRMLFRPSPISRCEDDINDIAKWWPLWLKFMFKTSLSVAPDASVNVFSLLETIPRAKYPALSETEEAVSLSLQCLCMALFDAVLVYLLHSVAPTTWQPLKWSLHKALYEDKATSCITILRDQYTTADVICIQEASETFTSRVQDGLSDFVVLCPNKFDARRSQISIILANRRRFVEASARDVTEEAIQLLQSQCTERGDLCVAEIVGRDGRSYLLASFHGDSSGRSTCPVLTAVHRLAQERYPDHVLIFGLDANTATDRSRTSSTLRVGGFHAHLAGLGLGSCWHPDRIDGVWTTCSARTYLQPQLQKAVGFTQVLDPSNMQLKDWVLFNGAQLALADTRRDNTGRREFVERVIPSQTFPSDHALVAVRLAYVAAAPAPAGAAPHAAASGPTPPGVAAAAAAPEAA